MSYINSHCIIFVSPNIMTPICLNEILDLLFVSDSVTKKLSLESTQNPMDCLIHSYQFGVETVRPDLKCGYSYIYILQ